MTRFTPTPVPPDKPLFQAAILVSLALHLLLLLTLGHDGLPRIPPWTPHALKVMLLPVPPAASAPEKPQLLAQHDAAAGRAAPQGKLQPAAAAPPPEPAPPAKIATPPVLHRAQAPIAMPDDSTDNKPHTDWLSQARQLATPAATPGKVRAVYGVNATGVKWARYVEDWRLKIERVGKLNYPAEARAQNLYGSLELTVVIRADGTLDSVHILRSSGHDILDKAAESIVRLSAPYPPFPPALAAEFPTLEIVRKWSFTTANQLSAN